MQSPPTSLAASDKEPPPGPPVKHHSEGRKAAQNQGILALEVEREGPEAGKGSVGVQLTTQLGDMMAAGPHCYLSSSVSVVCGCRSHFCLRRGGHIEVWLCRRSFECNYDSMI